MKYYKTYMDRQGVSDDLHHRLLAGQFPEPAVPTRPRRRWPRIAAAAVCCALVLGLGVQRFLSPGENISPDPIPVQTSDGTQPATGGWGQADFHGFVVEGGGTEEELTAFICVPYVAFPDVTGQPSENRDIAFPEGSFTVDLTEEQVGLILWNGARPEDADLIPWMLLWQGYTVAGRAWYDGNGNLFQVELWGEKGEDSFFVTLAPGQLPPTCVVREGAEVTEVNGVAVSAWREHYDRDGDELDEYVWESAFLAGEVGVRAQFVTGDTGELLVPQFINWCTGGLSLEHLLTAEDVPAFRSEDMSSLQEARQEEAFAAFLPETDFEGYVEFYGHMVCQEGIQHRLSVRWSWWDLREVSLRVDLPEDGGVSADQAVDVADPAAYDVRLYEYPWADTVPEQYQNTIGCPTFRAEDMSREVVAAREQEWDGAGSRFNFRVLYPDGTVIEYSCSGLTGNEVWALVAGAL